MVIQIEYDDEEDFEEPLEFLNKNKANREYERRERYHTAYHLGGLTYERQSPYLLEIYIMRREYHEKYKN